VNVYFNDKPEVAASGEETKSPVVPIVIVLLVLILGGAAGFFIMKNKGDDDGQGGTLPTSMAKGKLDDTRAVSNPLYEDVPTEGAATDGPATDGYIDVGTTEEKAVAAPAKKKKKDESTLSADDVGKRVQVEGFEVGGVLRFFGPHHETGKDRAGVELDEAVGKHSGTVKEHEYFKCEKKKGILVAAKDVTLFE
jgi:hypothetical protein